MNNLNIDNDNYLQSDINQIKISLIKECINLYKVNDIEKQLIYNCNDKKTKIEHKVINIQFFKYINSTLNSFKAKKYNLHYLNKLDIYTVHSIHKFIKDFHNNIDEMKYLLQISLLDDSNNFIKDYNIINNMISNINNPRINEISLNNNKYALSLITEHIETLEECRNNKIILSTKDFKKMKNFK